jgi:NADH dehydrogenase
MHGLVTVFGGSGFIGTQVVQALARQGFRVRVACRRPQLAYDLRPAGVVGQIHLTRAEVTDADSVARALEGADACVNLVAILYETPSRRFQQVHVEGSRNIARACAAAGIADLVHVSAIGADPKAKSEYARTKGEAELAVLDARPSARVLRPSVVFGPDDDFFNRFARLAAMAPVLPLFGGGKTRFQPVYVGDVAQAVARCVTDPSTAGRTYELAGPQTYTYRELMEIVCRETGRHRPLAPVPWTVAGLIGVAGNLMALTPLKPMLTSDQVLLLQRDNVAAPGAPGLADLGVVPTNVEAVVPSYLWRYRDGGQFAQTADAG